MSESWTNGCRVVSASYPNTGTRIETYFLDGSLAKVTGTAMDPVRQESGIEQVASIWRTFVKEIKLDENSNDTSEWTKTYLDGLGRSFRTVYPDGAARQNVFNLQGQLWKEIDPDLVTTIYQYNLKGELEYKAIDMNGDGLISFNGADRIIRTVREVGVHEGYHVQRTRTSVWTTDNADSPLEVAIRETTVDAPNMTLVWDTQDGLTTQTQIQIPGDGSRTETVIAPDNSQTITVYQNGRLQSSTRKDANGNQLGQITYGYDAHGRQSTITDARNGTTTWGFNNADQTTSVITPSPGSQTTSSYYDSMGRLTAITYPDATSVTNEGVGPGKRIGERAEARWPRRQRRPG